MAAPRLLPSVVRRAGWRAGGADAKVDERGPGAPRARGTPEPVEAIALVSMAAELLGLMLALPLVLPRPLVRPSLAAA